ncbi:hypothetical protein [Streptomyces sp. NPDC012888]|uniref:hypothetical protein n=1 Tax=Streptomyces sp. NPDC012888 TaxID=3364855 RepID=UPI00369D72C8
MDQSTPQPASPGSGTPAVVCARCGARHPEDTPLTWTCSVENGTREYFCHDCARANIRAIEGRLDSSWW